MSEVIEDGPRGGGAAIPLSRPLSPSDKLVLLRYETMAEGIARLFGSGCEVVVHSLEDISASVTKICNGHVTGRKPGSPITDLGLGVLRKSFESREDIVGPYFSRTDSGKLLKSTTILIRNDQAEPIGFLCVNFDLSVPLSQLLGEFSPSAEPVEQGEHYAPDVQELVSRAVAEELEAAARKTGLHPSEKNRRIVLELERRGVFEVKGAVEHAARDLGVTKHTVYKYLRELRG